MGEKSVIPQLRDQVRDASGRVGEVMDFTPIGGAMPTGLVLRPPGGGLEWRVGLDAVTPLSNWSSNSARGERFDAGEAVHVRDEPDVSVVVLPTHGRAEQVPPDVPPVSVCCVPVALVRTPAADDAMRWVELSDLTRAAESAP